MALTKPPAASPVWHGPVLKWTAAGVALLSPFWLYGMFTADTDYDSVASLFWLPVFATVAIALVLMCTPRERFLRRVMLTSLAAKTAAIGAFLYLAFVFYGGAADTAHYFFQGHLYADDVHWTGHWALLHPAWSSNAVYIFTGALIVFLGPALQAINFLYALMAFCAEYLFYRTFCMMAPPSADFQSAAVMFFLFPSLLFWTAGVGKDAPMALFIAMTVYGFAAVNKSVSAKGMLLLTIGLLGSLALRPHVAAMLSVSMLLPFALSKNRRGMSGIFAKAFIAPLLIAASFYLTWKAQDFLEMKDYQQATNVLRQVGQDNSFGNSTFNVSASLPARVAAAPLLFFRPFPWEARSLQGIIAAGEGLLLLWLTWKRRKYLWPAVRRWRENAFRAFLLLFLIEFSLVYSAAITNFGLLARERVMALPLLLMLIWLMPAEAAERTQNAAVSRFLNLRYSPGIVQSHTISQQSGSYPGGNS